MKDLNIHSTDFMTLLQGLTEGELKTLDNIVSNEMKRRKEKARVELVENFRDAFMAIRKAGIEVAVSDSCCSIADETYINNFDDFIFY